MASSGDDAAFWAETTEALLSETCTKFMAVNRPFHTITEEALHALSTCGSVQIAHLQLMGMNDDSCTALQRHGLPVDKSLTTLQMSRNRITSGGLDAFSAAALSVGSLTSLNLSANPLGADLAPFGHAIANSRVNTLDLSVTQEKESLGKGLVAMARALGAAGAACPLRSLVLQGNGVSDEAAVDLVAPLAAAGVCELMLGRNAIGDAGALALARGCTSVDEVGLFTSPFRKLGLMANCVGDAGAAAFANALKANCPLEHLNLGHNQIGDVGTEALTDGVRANTRISALDVGINQHSATTAARALAELMARDAQSRRRQAQFRRAARLVLQANYFPQPDDAPLGTLPHSLILMILEQARPAGFDAAQMRPTVAQPVAASASASTQPR